MPKTYENHWGYWIESRARAIGIKRKMDLAKKVGCSRQQLSRWIGMSRPPSEMRMGLDQSLCAALEVDQNALFFAWYHTDPTKLARTITPSDLRVPDFVSSEQARLLRRDITRWLHFGTDETLTQIRQVVIDMISKQDLGPPVPDQPKPYPDDIDDQAY